MTDAESREPPCDRCGFPIVPPVHRTRIGAAVHENANVCQQAEAAAKYARCRVIDDLQARARDLFSRLGVSR